MAVKNPLQSWDTHKQDMYRRKNPDKTFTWHFVLDASPSMIGVPGENLRRAYEIYLGWLQVHADPMSLVEVMTFSTEQVRHPVTPLGACRPLTPDDYDPRTGNGTALYQAVGAMCTAPRGAGQHILVVFTDGQDTTHAEEGEERGAGTLWTASKVQEVLKTLQDEAHWCAVFLGAFPEALAVGKAMGFPAGNCLVFPSDQIPEAFQTLLRATEQYLLATPEERKLLAAGQVFRA